MSVVNEACDKQVCTWEKVGAMPATLCDTTYKDPTNAGPEAQDVIIYNDWLHPNLQLI